MIKIIADTTCGIPIEQLLKLGIDVLPQIITFGDQSFRDDYELDTSTFLQKLSASLNLPGTAAPPPALYTPFYQKHLSNNDSILVITPSSEVSGTFRSASLAAEEFHDSRIKIIDSRTIAGGLGMLVLKASEWAQEAMTLENLSAKVTHMASKERVFFVVDTLEYLHKGGRIGNAASLIGSILQIKPILTAKDGTIGIYDKQRTSKHAITSIINQTLSLCRNTKNPYLTISQCNAEKQANQVRIELSNKLGLFDIPILVIPPAIVVHAGPGVISISCFPDL